MKENTGRFSRNGFFSISPECKLSGTLSLNGPDSVLHLWADHPFSAESPRVQTITGELDNQKKVSLIDCINIGGKRFFGVRDPWHHCKFFPHYVIVGNRHFSDSAKVIAGTSFVVDDATTLFDDRKSFGSLILKSDDLKKLNSLDVFNEIPFTEESPVIAYYTGKHEIFSADTVIGRVSARHAPSFDIGGPTGVSIRNKIFVDIQFNNPVNILGLDSRIRQVLRFFETVIGRPQNLLEVNIMHMGETAPESSSVYINMYPNRDRDIENRDPDSRDSLIDAAAAPEKFADLTCAWLERDETWRTARLRFSAGWRKQRNYDPDRIVGAANMFDLLPKEALPDDVSLPSELVAAVQECRERFEKLQESPKRDAVLGVLGRIKKQSLKKKIRYRSQFIVNGIGNYIKEIDVATDAAVELRNLYVHGDDGPNQKTKLVGFNNFLTDTLEFVFCASDLVESGWDIAAWHRRPKSVGHPFFNYLYGYAENLSKLKSHYKGSG